MISAKMGAHSSNCR